MTISEKKQLSNYIKRLVRESLGEMDSMDGWYNSTNHGYKDEDEYDEVKSLMKDFENGHYDDDAEKNDSDTDDKPTYDDENDYNKPAGLSELRRLAESYARQSVAQILSEGKKKGKKRKNKKEKTSSKDKTVISQLNADGTNAAHYFYKLYGVENGTEAQKAAARSKGYKKAKGKKNDTGVPYKFSSKERNRLSSLLTDRS